VRRLVADECDQLPPPSVTLRRLPEKLSIDTRYGYREITHLAAEIARPGTRVLGLTRGTATVRAEIRSPSLCRPLATLGMHEPATRRDLRLRPDDGLHRPRVSREELRATTRSTRTNFAT
jgi:hypothetical protein